MSPPKWSSDPSQPCFGPLFSPSSSTTAAAAVAQGSSPGNQILQPSSMAQLHPQNMAGKPPAAATTRRGRRPNSKRAKRTKLRALLQKQPPSSDAGSTSSAAAHGSELVAAQINEDLRRQQPFRPERGKSDAGVIETGEDKEKNHTKATQDYQQTLGAIASDNPTPDSQRSCNNNSPTRGPRHHRMFKGSETTADQEWCLLLFLTASFLTFGFHEFAPLQVLVDPKYTAIVVHIRALELLGWQPFPIWGHETMPPVLYPGGVLQPRSWARLICQLPGMGFAGELTIEWAFVDEGPYRGVDFFLGTEFTNMIGGCLPRDLLRGMDAASHYVTIGTHPVLPLETGVTTLSVQGVEYVQPLSSGDDAVGEGSSTLVESGVDNMGYASSQSVARIADEDHSLNTWSIPASAPQDNNAVVSEYEQASTLLAENATESSSCLPMETHDLGTSGSTGGVNFPDGDEYSSFFDDFRNDYSTFGEDDGADYPLR